MATDNHECISQGKSQVMSAVGRVTTGLDDTFQRARVFRRDGRYFFGVTEGRDGNFSVSGRDWAEIVRGDGGTGR